MSIALEYCRENRCHIHSVVLRLFSHPQTHSKARFCVCMLLRIFQHLPRTWIHAVQISFAQCQIVCMRSGESIRAPHRMWEVSPMLQLKHSYSAVSLTTQTASLQLQRFHLATSQRLCTVPESGSGTGRCWKSSWHREMFRVVLAQEDVESRPGTGRSWKSSWQREMLAAN